MNPNPCHYGQLCNNGDLLVQSLFGTVTTVYDPYQLRKYLDLEDMVRQLAADRQSIDLTITPIPVGLPEFAAHWNEDPLNRYGFSTINLADGTITVDPRPAPPRNLLIPTIAYQSGEGDPHALSHQERKDFDLVMLASAKREALRTNLSSKKHGERKANRTKKALLASYAKGMKSLSASVARAQEAILDDTFDELAAVPTVPSTPITIRDTPPPATLVAAGPPALEEALGSAIPRPSTFGPTDRDVSMHAAELSANQ